MRDRLFHFKRSAIVLAIVLAGALIVAIAPTEISADEHDEAKFEKFQPVTFSGNMLFDLEALAEELDPLTMLLIYVELQGLGQFETDITQRNLREVDSLTELSTHIGDGFPSTFDLPRGLRNANEQFFVVDSGYAQYTFDVAKARRISRLLGVTPNWLPSAAEHETLTVRLDVPDAGAAIWKSRNNMLAIGQSPIPELTIPDEIDFQALIDSIATDARLPEELTSQFGAFGDWQKTLPVPIPEEAEHEMVMINGNPGILITIDEGSALLWSDYEIVRAIVGTFDSETLIELAEAMQ